MRRDKYSAGYELLILADCFFNWLAGGRGDVTISARVGYHALKNHKHSHKWEKARRRIDWAFDPIQGAGHCEDAYLAKPEDDYTDHSTYRINMVLFFVGAACPLIRLVNSIIARGGKK